MRSWSHIYWTVLGLRLKSFVANPVDSGLLMVSALLTDGVALVFLWGIMLQTPSLSGWDARDVVLLYGFVTAGGGMTQLFFDGLWTISSGVHEGRFDYFLVRPVPILLSLVTNWMSPEGVGGILLGGTLISFGLAEAPAATVADACVVAALFLSGVGVRVGITLAVNALGFWAPGPTASSLGLVTEPVYDFARFPLSTYPAGLGATLFSIVPLAFIAYVPASFALDRELPAAAYMLSPVASACVCGIAWQTFRRGVRVYTSVGA